MKQLFLLIALCFLAIPASATIALRHDSHGNCNTHPCSVTITSTTSGDLGVLIYWDGAGSVRTLTSVSDGTSTWVVPAGCGISSAGQNTFCAYTLNLAGSKTSLTITNSGAATDGNVEFLEYSFTGSSITYDTSGTNTSEPGSTTQNGVTLTLNGSTDVIIQAFNGNNVNKVVSAISGSYSNPADFVSGPDNLANYYGVGGWVNTSSASPVPTWTTTGALSAGVAIAIAFTENSSVIQRRRASVVQS